MERQPRRTIFERYHIAEIGGAAVGLAMLVAVAYEVRKKISRPESLLDKAALTHKGGAYIKTAAALLGSPADLMSYDRIEENTGLSGKLTSYAVGFLVDHGLARRGQDDATRDYYVRLDPVLPAAILQNPQAYQHVIDAIGEQYPGVGLTQLEERFGNTDTA